MRPWLFVSAALSVVGGIASAYAQAEFIYQYNDAKGNPVYVDDPSKVPKELRPYVRIIRAVKPPAAAASARPASPAPPGAAPPSYAPHRPGGMSATAAIALLIALGTLMGTAVSWLAAFVTRLRVSILVLLIACLTSTLAATFLQGWAGMLLGLVLFLGIVWKWSDADSGVDLALFLVVCWLFEILARGAILAAVARGVDASEVAQRYFAL